MIPIHSLLLQLVTEKKIQRQLNILATLKKSYYPISIEELAEQFQVSSKTIRQDIDQLLTFAPTGQRLVEETNSGILLQPVDSSVVDQMFCHLSSDVLSFKLLDLLFVQKALTLDVLEDICFVSEATLKRHVLKLRKILKKYSLSLTLSPVQLIGKEENIRYFYFQYFHDSENIRDTYQPEASHQESVAYLSLCLEEKLKLKILLDHKRLAFWQMVQKLRFKNGFYYEGSDIHAEEIFFPKKYKLFKMIYLDIQKRFYPEIIGFSENEMIFSYAASLDCIVYKDYLFGEPDFSFKDPTLQKTLYKLSIEISQHFNTEIHEVPDFFKALQNYFAVHFFLNRITPLFKKNDSHIVQFIRQEHPATFSKWLCLLSSSSAFQPLKVEHIDDICANLTIYTVIYLYQEKTEQKKVLFALNGDNVFLDYLLLVINKTFSGIHMQFLLNKAIELDFLKRNQIDVVISNYPSYIAASAQKLTQYELAPVPTMEDWQNVRRFLTTILSKDEFE
ncbi:helix-turn-helix domain-containing protein [Enterococcus sp. BWR-S5]|uniref:helix-turn-helix domain-containing protein n=1 Tax=Enterococcus sp. BWR-S5 TaxID=2787714 RepID=UPI0019229BFC|nr:helix-turn-helix domain-containing protein [Enterococcus sp. BWR-S5]MBL1226420.1 helix-turn-helix domain-containing protein [Enterococcus sp. BWR-S5]